MLVSTNDGSSGSALMQVFARPVAPPDPYTRSLEYFLEVGYGVGALVLFPDQAIQILADELIHRRIPVECHLSRRPEQVLIQGQGEVFLHRTSVARIMCQ